MKRNNTIFKTLLLRVVLVLSMLVLTFCQEKGEDIVDANKDVSFTKYSEISTLMKTAISGDDDQQCIFFQYPFTFYAQLSSSSSIEVISINSDDELFDFFDQLASSDQIRLDFPIHLIGVDGEITEINTLNEFKDTLQLVVDACSGSSEYEYCHSNNKKVYICHNGTTICVSINAINAHLEHGDELGQCD
ncbi:MAG: hypothetical protein HKN40_01595 [Winogradskyella sp.]|uniref:hypothetical protein n=1 Tax=Winogradskyella sp. TaxID=1883156 RepID=UPI0017B8119C|nr:hypothetical protein [Winogradskyella sp.]